jgi:hypothetical protein
MSLYAVSQLLKLLQSVAMSKMHSCEFSHAVATSYMPCAMQLRRLHIMSASWVSIVAAGLRHLSFVPAGRACPPYGFCAIG